MKQALWISSANILLMVFLQLALRTPLHTLFDPSDIMAAIHRKQDQGYSIAVTPPRLKDQFQFAGRLTRPLIALNSIDELAEWTRLNPQQYFLTFSWSKKNSLLPGEDVVDRFNIGYLTLRSASNFNKDFERWE